MQRLRNFSKNFKDFVINSQRRDEMIEAWKSSKSFSMKKAIGYSALLYFGGTTYYLSKTNEDFSIKMSFPRNVSRFSGWVSGQYIPESMRKTLFGTFAKTYNVIESDMIEPFEKYETFNQFFTRKVKAR